MVGKDVLRKEIGSNWVYPIDSVTHSGTAKARPITKVGLELFDG